MYCCLFSAKLLGCVGVVLYLRIHGCHEQLGGDKGNRMALRLGLCGIRWQCVCIFFQSFQLLGIDKFDRGACYMVAVIDIIEIVGSDVWHVSKQLRETLILSATEWYRQFPRMVSRHNHRFCLSIYESYNCIDG